MEMESKIKFDLEWKFKQNMNRIMEERVLVGQVLLMHSTEEFDDETLDRVRKLIQKHKLAK